MLCSPQRVVPSLFSVDAEHMHAREMPCATVARVTGAGRTCAYYISEEETEFWKLQFFCVSSIQLLGLPWEGVVHSARCHKINGRDRVLHSLVTELELSKRDKSHIFLTFLVVMEPVGSA